MLWIAMGWDTEGDIQGLDLDLSLVPVNPTKYVIQSKVVDYRQKAPPALRCGKGGSHLAMRAFNDDQDGEGAGDDELVQMDLACLNGHVDVQAVLVMCNIYKPAITWSEIDSAYLRIISGGHHQTRSGNHYIENAESVRSFVRLTGNALKASPDMAVPGLIVGLFFRDTRPGTWAFASLMSGIPGKNVMLSMPHIRPALMEMVYPANPRWADTQDVRNAHSEGAFGAPGLYTKASYSKLIEQGELPCIASRKDHSLVILGRMTPEDLAGVVNNPRIAPEVKDLAKKLLGNEALAKKMRGISNAYKKMETVNTSQGRAQVAQSMATAPEEATVTQEESNQAMMDLDSLFDVV